jgi:hypothetical protein
MKIALGAFTSILLAGAMYMQPAHAQVQIQPAPGSSVQIGTGAPSLPPPPPEEWRRREGYYGSRGEDRRQARRARDRCDHIRNPIERDWCFTSLRQ